MKIKEQIERSSPGSRISVTVEFDWFSMDDIGNPDYAEIEMQRTHSYKKAFTLRSTLISAEKIVFIGYIPKIIESGEYSGEYIVLEGKGYEKRMGIAEKIRPRINVDAPNIIDIKTEVEVPGEPKVVQSIIPKEDTEDFIRRMQAKKTKQNQGTKFIFEGIGIFLTGIALGGTGLWVITMTMGLHGLGPK